MQRMLRSRISRRVLAEQHIALTRQYHELQEHGQTDTSSRYIGIIDTALSPQATIAETAELISLATGTADCKISVEGPDSITFPFIRDHLQYIVFELCKNAALAAQAVGKAVLIAATLTHTAKTIALRISDQCKLDIVHPRSR